VSKAKAVPELWLDIEMPPVSTFKTPAAIADFLNRQELAKTATRPLRNWKWGRRATDADSWAGIFTAPAQKPGTICYDLHRTVGDGIE
jgi:hypothetical protein